MTEQKLTELGFGEVYSATIRRTRERMRTEIEANPDLADRIYDEISTEYAPYPIQDRYDVFLESWIKEQAEALHNEIGLAFLAPFKAVASLF